MCSRARPALVECQACQRPMSPHATACPSCGHPRHIGRYGRLGKLPPGMVACTVCATPHAISASACPKCGNPHDPEATRRGISREQAAKDARRRDREDGGDRALLAIVGLGGTGAVVVVGGLLAFLLFSVCAGVLMAPRHRPAPKPSVELPAEAPPHVEPKPHD